MALTRAETLRLLPGTLVTLALIGAAAYSLPKYVDHRIDLYMTQHDVAGHGNSRTKAEVVAAQDFLRKNRKSISIGMPSQREKANAGLKQIVVFTDYRCTYCKAMERYLDGDKTVKIKVVFKELPILGESSKTLSLYALAADRAGKYLDYRAHMLAIPSPSESDARTFFERKQIKAPDAQELQQLEKLVAANAAEAKGLAIKGTPAIVVGNSILYGWNPNEFKAKILSF